MALCCRKKRRQMKNKYVFVAMLLVVLALAGFGFTKSYMQLEQRLTVVTEEPIAEDSTTEGQPSIGEVAVEGEVSSEELHIVTSFYPMYVATLNVVGDCEGVVVENLSEPQTGCLHDYQLTPQDMILLSEADVFVVNGGGIEGFLTEVAEAYPDLHIINAGNGIFSEEESVSGHDHEEENAGETEHIHEEENAGGTEHIHEEEDAHAGHNHGENAHVWLSIPHYMEQIEAISCGLAEADSARSNSYEDNAAVYLKQITELWQESESIRQEAMGQNIIIFHEAFELMAEDYGMQVAGVLNLDEERQVSAGEVADILTTIEEKKIEILLAEDLYGKDMGDTIEAETDCTVYYMDTLVRGDGTKDSWIRGMEQNIELLKTAILK